MNVKEIVTKKYFSVFVFFLGPLFLTTACVILSLEMGNDLIPIAFVLLSATCMVGCFIPYRIAKEYLSKVKIYHCGEHYHYIFRDVEIHNEILKRINLNNRLK